MNSGASVVAPAQLSIGGNYTNSGTYTAGGGTTTFVDGGTATGTMTGTSAFNNVAVTGDGTRGFMKNASTTNLLITASSTFSAPASLSVSGNLTNSGTYDIGLGKTWTAQTGVTVAGIWASVAYGTDSLWQCPMVVGRTTS